MKNSDANENGGYKMQVATNKMVRALEEQAYLFKGHTLKELAITVKDYRDYLQSTKHAIVSDLDPTALLRKLRTKGEFY